MKIVIVGAGYVGLVSGVCFSDFGHDVVCVEKNVTKLEMLKNSQIPIYEPGLGTMLTKNFDAGRISFSDSLSDTLEDVDAVFIAVGTPSVPGSGHADLTYVFQTAKEIADAMPPDILVVTKSTVPIGTNRKISDIIQKQRPGVKFHIVSNPEFLREGSAIADFMRPDRVVVGVESEHALEVMRKIYRPLYIRETPILATDLETAEIIKYAANAFLATKIAFINEIANLCELVGGDVQQVAKGIGMDNRIGSHFLHAGPGYGGSCFPKDTMALAQTGQEVGAPLTIIKTVIQSNENRKQAMAAKIIAACNGSVQGKQITIFGVTFKPNTDDMREAPSLAIVQHLLDAGAEITVSDPKGEIVGKALLPTVKWEIDPYIAASKASAIVLLTEWNEFRGLDIQRLASNMFDPIFIDLRNVYSSPEMTVAGMKYFSVGKIQNGNP